MKLIAFAAFYLLLSGCATSSGDERNKQEEPKSTTKKVSHPEPLKEEGILFVVGGLILNYFEHK